LNGKHDPPWSVSFLSWVSSLIIFYFSFLCFNITRLLKIISTFYNMSLPSISLLFCYHWAIFRVRFSLLFLLTKFDLNFKDQFVVKHPSTLLCAWYPVPGQFSQFLMISMNCLLFLLLFPPLFWYLIHEATVVGFQKFHSLFKIALDKTLIVKSITTF
jgi:hypothetical protein